MTMNNTFPPFNHVITLAVGILMAAASATLVRVEISIQVVLAVDICGYTWNVSSAIGLPFYLVHTIH